ncbi:MAG: hypothetical protein DRJ05_02210 [Bacteroidetes bacterium]|nr:MAG: hypothetical protein DRJ05_02210 [Bacteroidota bacterium]
MNISELNISGNTIFRLLLSTLALFIFFRFVDYLFKVFRNKSPRVKSFSHFLPIVEMFAWILFLIWAANFFIEENRILAIGVLTILVFVLFWISRYAIKNIIAGVLFRFQGNYSVGDFLRTKDYSGKIQQFTFFSLQITTKDGHSVFIPFSKLMDEVNVRYDMEVLKAGYNFKIMTPKDVGPDEMAEKIKLALLSMSWISVKQMPQIKQVYSDGPSYSFEIILFAVNNKYALKTENEIGERFAVKV